MKKFDFPLLSFWRIPSASVTQRVKKTAFSMYELYFMQRKASFLCIPIRNLTRWSAGGWFPCEC